MIDDKHEHAFVWACPVKHLSRRKQRASSEFKMQGQELLPEPCRQLCPCKSTHVTSKTCLCKPIGKGVGRRSVTISMQVLNAGHAEIHLMRSSAAVCDYFHRFEARPECTIHFASLGCEPLRHAAPPGMQLLWQGMLAARLRARARVARCRVRGTSSAAPYHAPAFWQGVHAEIEGHRSWEVHRMLSKKFPCSTTMDSPTSCKRTLCCLQSHHITSHHALD